MCDVERTRRVQPWIWGNSSVIASDAVVETGAVVVAGAAIPEAMGAATGAGIAVVIVSELHAA